MREYLMPIFVVAALALAGCNKSKSPEDVSKDVAKAEQKANNEVAKSEERAQARWINRTRRSMTRRSNSTTTPHTKPTMWPSQKPMATAKWRWRLANRRAACSKGVQGPGGSRLQDGARRCQGQRRGGRAAEVTPRVYGPRCSFRPRGRILRPRSWRSLIPTSNGAIYTCVWTAD